MEIWRAKKVNIVLILDPGVRRGDVISSGCIPLMRCATVFFRPSYSEIKTRLFQFGHFTARDYGFNQ